MNQKEGTLDLFAIVCIITITFLLQKIFGAITWSWFWVFSPLLFYFGIGMTVFFAALFILIQQERKKGK